MKSLPRPFDSLLITSVTDGAYYVNDLFGRKFGGSAPDYGHSVVCFFRKDSSTFMPLCYVHYHPYDEVILVGGGMTDGKVFAHMDNALSSSIRDSGGIFYHVLKFGFDHFKDQCEAFFGYAGDKRAYEVDLKAGFVPTQHQHLIAHFHKPVSESQRVELIEKVHALGSF